MSDLPIPARGRCDVRKVSKMARPKSRRLVLRDIKRGNTMANRPAFKQAIHEAVLRSEGRDAYTGELLNWSLIGTYEDEKSKAGKSVYKATFALLPTADHAGDVLGPADFEICGWATNDAKNDLTHEQFARSAPHADRARPPDL